MNKFSKRLKKLRKEHGLTQEELADILKITRSRLSMYEQGKREPSFEMQEAIADYFNVDLDYLMGRTDNKPDFVIIPSDYDIEKRIYGLEKASVIELVKTMDDKEIDRLIQLLGLMFPEINLLEEGDEE